MEQKDNREEGFVQEKIKMKPLNKKKLLQKILIERLNLISIWMIVNLFLAKFANWGIAR